MKYENVRYDDMDAIYLPVVSVSPLPQPTDFMLEWKTLLAADKTITGKQTNKQTSKHTTKCHTKVNM